MQTHVYTKSYYIPSGKKDRCAWGSDIRCNMQACCVCILMLCCTCMCCVCVCIYACVVHVYICTCVTLYILHIEATQQGMPALTCTIESDTYTHNGSQQGRPVLTCIIESNTYTHNGYTNTLNNIYCLCTCSKCQEVVSPLTSTIALDMHIHKIYIVIVGVLHPKDPVPV